MVKQAKPKQAIEGASRLNAFAMDPEDLILIEDKAHPLYDPRVNLPINEGMVRSIMQNNVIKAIIVRKDGKNIEVVDGRQRTKAACEANRRLKKEGRDPLRVPVMVRRGDDGDLFGVTIATNEHRTSDDVVTKANKALRFVQQLGRSEKEAAIHFGVSEQSIRMWFKLLDTAPQVQKAVADGSLGFVDAVKKLADLPREQQLAELPKLVESSTKRTKTDTNGVKRKTQAGVSRARARKVYEAVREAEVLREDTRALLGWIAGDFDDDQIIDKLPSLRAILKPEPKAPKGKKAKGNGVVQPEASA